MIFKRDSKSDFGVDHGDLSSSESSKLDLLNLKFVGFDPTLILTR